MNRRFVALAGVASIAALLTSIPAKGQAQTGFRYMVRRHGWAANWNARREITLRRERERHLKLHPEISWLVRLGLVRP